MEELAPINGTEGLTYGLVSGKMAVTGINEEFPPDYTKTVYVASVFDNQPVVTVATGAFNNNKQIRDIYLPDSIKEIQHFAFKSCPELKHIRFPEKLNSMVWQSIYDCLNLQEIYIPFVKVTSGKPFAGNTRTTVNGINVYVDGQTFNDSLFDGYRNIHSCTAPARFYQKMTAKSTIKTATVLKNVVPPLPQPLFSQYASLTDIYFNKDATQFTSNPIIVNCPKLKTVYFESVPKVNNNYISKLFGSMDTTGITIYANWKKSEFELSEEIVGTANVEYLPEKGYSWNNEDNDYIGFTFNGYHCIKDLNIYRVSDGNRYNLPLGPQISEETSSQDENEGIYYLKQKVSQGSFNIAIAFDNLSEVQWQKLQKVFNTKQQGELIFDEEPYKAYDAKITGSPSLNFMCFEFNGKNIYKGEGNIQFTCYSPYAHTPTGKSIFIEDYSLSDYPTKPQWIKGSNLPNRSKFVLGQNFGELPSPFIMTVSCFDAANNNISGYQHTLNKGTKIYAGNNFIITKEDCVQVIWNSKTGIVKGVFKINDNTYETRVMNYEGNSVCALPVLKDKPPQDYIGPNFNYMKGSKFEKYVMTIDYQFWYY